MYRTEADRVDVYALAPILRSELAALRADPAAQSAWIAARTQQGDLDAIMGRWQSVA